MDVLFQVCLKLAKGFLRTRLAFKNFNAFSGIFISLEHVFLHLNWRGPLFYPKMSNHVGPGKVLTKVVVLRQREGQRAITRTYTGLVELKKRGRGYRYSNFYIEIILFH